MFRAFLKNPVFICSTGSTIEWIEYSAYLYLVPVLSKVFLPDNDPAQAALIIFCLFFATNLSRPPGGFINGDSCFENRPCISNGFWFSAPVAGLYHRFFRWVDELAGSLFMIMGLHLLLIAPF